MTDRCDVCGGEFKEKVQANKQSGQGAGAASFAAWSEIGRGLVQVCSKECERTRHDRNWRPTDLFLARWYPAIRGISRRHLWDLNREAQGIVDDSQGR